MAYIKQNTEGCFHVFSLFDDMTGRLVRADIEADSLPSKGDIVGLSPEEGETKGAYYRITGMLYVPNAHGFLIAQLLGEKLRGWPMLDRF